MAQTASTAIFINSHHPGADKKCSISIRVTYKRVKKYYPLKFRLTAAEYKRMMGERPRKELKDILLQLQSLEKKANDIINNLPVFTFEGFRNLFEENRGAADTIAGAFDNYIEQLNNEKRVGNAAAYLTAKNSLLAYCEANNIKDLAFADVNKTFLKKYEAWMDTKGNSKTTVGIYLRSLRTLFNMAIHQKLITQQLYPFGKREYSIPASSNIKKALSDSTIKLIANYDAAPGSTREKMRDYFMIIFYLGGINVADLCRLKHKNIQGDNLIYERTKTKDTKAINNQIRVPIPPAARKLINKHASKAINPEAYLFDELRPGITPIRQRDKIKLVTHLVNSHLKEIAKELKIPFRITTYSARHSAITAYVRGGVPMAAVSKLAGHTSIKTTELYVGSIIDENAEKIQNAITAFEHAV